MIKYKKQNNLEISFSSLVVTTNQFYLDVAECCNGYNECCCAEIRVQFDTFHLVLVTCGGLRIDALYFLPWTETSYFQVQLLDIYIHVKCNKTL